MASVPPQLKPDARILTARAGWRYRGDRRPEFALAADPGQESVWDYPRPPLLIADARRVVVRHGERVLADSVGAFRVLETASPPTFYLPPADVRLELLVESGRRSHCEWKGEALDLDLVQGPTSVAWVYRRTYAEFLPIAGWVAFYPSRVDCLVGGERVRPQPGGYYGGWITDEIVGPVKGEPGVEGL